MERSTTLEPDKLKIEAIDQDITRAMHHGIKTIHKIYTSPFSPQIKQARLRRRFYKLQLSMLINKLDFTSQLESLLQALDEELSAPSNLEEARKLLRDAQKSVQEITKRASELRVTYLEEKAQSLEAIDKEKAPSNQENVLQTLEIPQTTRSEQPESSYDT
jgi:hypothetical protein